MRYRATRYATLLALILCLYNYTGYDIHNMVFFMFSVPAWGVDLFMDVHEVSVLAMYAATILTYALIGYVIDRLIIRQREKGAR